MATICRDHDLAATAREPMGGPPMPRQANTHGHGLISTNRGGTKRYYHYDALGTVWALSTGTGSVSDQYNYTAFGVALSSSGSTVNPYRFVGQWGYYDDGALLGATRSWAPLDPNIPPLRHSTPDPSFKGGESGSYDAAASTP